MKRIKVSDLYFISHLFNIDNLRIIKILIQSNIQILWQIILVYSNKVDINATKFPMVNFIIFLYAVELLKISIVGFNIEHFETSKEEINNFHKSIAQNIKKLRKERNITQLELALRIGHKSMSTIAKIESNLENKHYNIEQLYKISKALDIDIKKIF